MGVPAAAHRVAGCRLQVGSGVGRHDGGVVVAAPSRVAGVRKGGRVELGLRRVEAEARIGVGVVV